MADQDAAQNRTEDPTPRRRQKAREEGQIARSHELAAATMLLAGAALLATVGGRSIAAGTIELFRIAPGWLLLSQPSLVGVATLVREVTWRAGAAVAPFAIGLAVVAVAIGLLQTHGNYTWKPVEPDLSRISPFKGFRRVFGADAAINLVKSALKLLILGAVVFTAIRGAWPHFVALGTQSPAEIGAATGATTLRMTFTAGLAFLAIGGFDYAIQFFRTEKSLKMARHEVLQEHKEQEGDPQVKARIRQIARQRARQRMLAQVARADVVVTNPTHIAVALKYDLALAGAPVILAMGERKLAERIKAIARKHGVPTVENKPLARALLATGAVGAPIPAALYVAVAEILAYVYRIRRRMPAALASRTGAGVTG